MPRIPIFDTNVFDHLERGLISRADWKRLLNHRPQHGWSLSVVTALELLAGFDANPQGFLESKQRISRAYSLSRGRILEDPRFLICKEILRIPFPDQPHPPSLLLSKHMDVIRRAASLSQLKTGVPYTLWRGAQLTATAVYDDVMAAAKQDWVRAVKRVADETYRDWREEEKLNGKRLPREKRRELKQQSYWQRQRASFIDSLLKWLGASSNTATITDMSQRLDAVLDFTIFVSRSFLLSNYSAEDHDSDLFDMFQLQYLAMDRFVIVTADRPLLNRTKESSQAHRIMSFDQFLHTL
ncbi:MAG TPA: hypothetical protein VF532_17150 [Candidatus Angelobacter sp.]